jgi:AcrR family transcriptional regulator
VAAILEAAADILERDGYRAASTNAIARRAGVSVGSLYQYFSSREDIFRVLAAQHRAAIHPVIDAAMARLAADRERPCRVLSDLLGEMLEAHAARPVLMHALETELVRVLLPERILEEAGEVEAAARLLASRIRRPPSEAMARAWLVAEMTGMVSRKLAHDAPGWVDPGQVQAAFAEVMKTLLE